MVNIGDLQNKDGDLLLPNNILEDITYSNGRVIKLANGLMIQNKKSTVKLYVNLWATGTYYQDVDLGNWIVPFIEQPILLGDHIYTENNAYVNQLVAGNGGNITMTSASIVRGIRPDNAMNTVNADVTFSRTAIGKWK